MSNVLFIIDLRGRHVCRKKTRGVLLHKFFYIYRKHVFFSANMSSKKQQKQPKKVESESDDAVESDDAKSDDAKGDEAKGDEAKGDDAGAGSDASDVAESERSARVVAVTAELAKAKLAEATGGAKAKKVVTTSKAILAQDLADMSVWAIVAWTELKRQKKFNVNDIPWIYTPKGQMPEMKKPKKK